MRPLLLLKTYGWLINVLRERKSITLKEIKRLWELNRISDGNELIRQTFVRYKNDIEELFGIDIYCDKQYRYYLANKPETFSHKTVAYWMMEAISSGMAFAYKSHLRQRIVVEDIPSAAVYLCSIAEAMESSVMIAIDYHRYGCPNMKTHTVKPLFMKLYHQRWYLIGEKEDGNILTFSLDRIKRLEKTEQTFVFDERMTAEEYFSGCFGVMRDESLPVERVVLRAYGTQANYLRDLKLHSSQREVATHDDYSDFELFVRISYDFKGKIMEMGDRAKVIEPAHLSHEIMENHARCVKIYKKNEDSSMV